MSTREIRISDLTVEEFRLEIRGQILDVLRDFQSYLTPPASNNSQEQDIIFLEEAMKLVGMGKGAIYNRKSDGTIPIICGGNPLTFSRTDLMTWMEHGRPSVAEMKAMGLLKKRKK